MFHKTEKNRDFKARLQDAGSRLPQQDNIVEYNEDLRNSQVFEMQLKANASVASLQRRKTTKHDLQNAMETDSKISLPQKLACRRVSINGSFRGTIGGFGRRSRTHNSIAGCIDQEEMNIQGHFILLMVANIFLSGDYEYCLSICSHNFSHVANTSLFEGNILRYQALAAERLFQHQNSYPNPQDRSSAPLKTQEFKQLENLFLALDSAQQALEVYRNRQIQNKPCPNHYGMALQQFQIGYLYDTYANVLCQEQARQMAVNQNSHLIYNDAESHIKQSINYFNDAFTNFSIVDHLKGMQLSKKHVVDLQNKMLKNQKSHLQSSQTLRDLEARFKDYLDKFGSANCPHIPREGGEDTSLLVEIVDKNTQESLFKQVQVLDQPQPKKQQLFQQFTISETDNEGEESVISGKQPQSRTLSNYGPTHHDTLESRDPDEEVDF